MRPRDVQRGISSRSVRVEGDAPGIGRVARVRRQQGKGDGARRRRSSREPRGNKYSILITSGVFGLVALVAIGTAVFFWIRQVPAGPAPGTAASEITKPAKTIASKFASPSQEESISLVKRALAISDPADVPMLVRTGSTTPEEVIEFFKASDRRDGPIEKVRWLSSLDSDGLLIEGVLVSFQSDEKKKERLALLTPDETGRWLLDFESYARKMDTTWEDLISGRTQHARARVMAAADRYYNGLFNDEAKWTCYALASPDTDDLMQGYCLNGSEEAEKMAIIFKDSDAELREQTAGFSQKKMKTTRAILDLARVPGASSKQFQIVRVLAREWVLPDDAPPVK